MHSFFPPSNCPPTLSGNASAARQVTVVSTAKSKTKRYQKPHKPKRIHRTLVSSMKNSAEFGIQMNRMESAVKEINYQTKGTEMFWNHPAGAEAILQIHWAALSDDDRLTRFLTHREGPAKR